jgi:hypothetical protein
MISPLCSPLMIIEPDSLFFLLQQFILTASLRTNEKWTHCSYCKH